LLPIKHIAQAQETDEALLQQFKRSFDQDILARLFMRYYELVYGTCLKYLKDGETEVDNFKSWLYVLSKNHCLMQLRAGKKMITVEFQPTLMQSDDFAHLDTILDREQDFIKLENCVEQLPEEQKQSIQLFYLENKCYNEIVTLTGMEWNKVRSLIQNGRRNLKICMETNA
jgi:RNA polymerase sigma factor (sigma-70 family)